MCRNRKSITACEPSAIAESSVADLPGLHQDAGGCTERTGARIPGKEKEGNLGVKLRLTITPRECSILQSFQQGSFYYTPRVYGNVDLVTSVPSKPGLCSSKPNPTPSRQCDPPLCSPWPQASHHRILPMHPATAPALLSQARASVSIDFSASIARGQGRGQRA